MKEQVLEFYRVLAKSPTPKSTKIGNADLSHIDAQFILKYATKESEILDLGSGTGLIVNKIYPFVGSIVCVEAFCEFAQFIQISENITIVNQDVFAFETQQSFDMITAFGIMQYFDEQESMKIYAKYKQYLKPNGILIIKNQFGLTETVNVAGYSEEQKQDYYSQYRWIETEKQNLVALGFKIVEVNDIYPKEANRWENTHFYALVARV